MCYAKQAYGSNHSRHLLMTSKRQVNEIAIKYILGDGGVFDKLPGWELQVQSVSSWVMKPAKNMQKKWRKLTYVGNISGRGVLYANVCQMEQGICFTCCHQNLSVGNLSRG